MQTPLLKAVVSLLFILQIDDNQLSLRFLTELSRDTRREAVLLLQYNQSGPYVSHSETKPALDGGPLEI